MQINNLQSLVSNSGVKELTGRSWGIDEIPAAQAGAIGAGLGGVLRRVLRHQPVLPPSART